jgi:threonine 3-dehydrogenase
MDKRRAMRAVRKERAGAGAALTERPVPEPGPGEVRVRVAAASVCGTDVSVWRWNAWAERRVAVPLTLGHECAGRIDVVGAGVTSVREGQRVAIETHVVCGACPACRSGDAHACAAVRILGLDRDGAFADYLVVPAANAWPLPEKVPWHVAPLLESFGNAVHTALAQPLTARTVLVTGAGPTGLGATAVARAAGAAAVVVVEGSPERRALALRLGADAVLDPGEATAEAVRAAAGEASGLDVALEMSGSAEALRLCVGAVRSAGRVSVLGLASAPVALDWAEGVVMRGLTLYGVTGRRLWQTWQDATRLIASGRVDLTPLITHRFPLERVEDAVATAAGGHAGKVLVSIGEEESPPAGREPTG